MVIRRLDSEIEANMDARGRSWALPMPGKRFLEDLRASAALPAAGAYELTNPIEVWKSRLAHLYVSVDAAAIGNRVSIVPELSMDPNGSDDSFFTIGITDGSVSPVDLGVAPGGTYSEFNFGAVSFLPMEIRTAATDNATDTIRMSVTIDVNQAYWIRFRIAEFGDTMNPSTVKLEYAKSV